MVTQPDLLVVPRKHLDDKIYFVSRLLLAFELLSPSSAHFDRVIKRPRHQRNRVPEYWVVDRESRTFERWQPDDERPAILSETLVWHPDGAASTLELDIVSLFDEAEEGQGRKNSSLDFVGDDTTSLAFRRPHERRACRCSGRMRRSSPSRHSS